jgi:putative hydrolase
MTGPSNGFEGLLGDLLKAMGGTPAAAWFDAAKALAVSVVADEHESYNPDPVARIKLEELARVVSLHVAEVTGDAVDAVVEPVTRAAWGVAALTSWRPRLEPLVAATATSQTSPGAIDDEPADAATAMLAKFAASMGPMFLGLQVGSTAGHLAERALGSSAFPLPWPDASHALIVARNLDQFAEDWSLDHDAVAAFTIARELVMRAVYSRPAIALHVEALLDDATAAQMSMQKSLLERLGDADGVEDLSRMLGDPEAFVEGLWGHELPEGGRAHDALNAAVTAIGAYVDEAAKVVAARILGDAGQLAEAWHRHRTGDSKGAEAAAAMFGVDLTRERVDLGAAFVAGVIERDGFEALARLTASPEGLPTPAEIVAPGLWLARTSLPAIDGEGTD